MIKPLSREEYSKLIKKNKKNLGENYCPFCDKKNIEKTTLWSGENRRLVYNFSPYSGDNNHIMAIPFDHIIYSADLTKNHLQELNKVHKEVKKYFENKPYFSFTRESLDNTRSVEHLHIHFLIGRLEADNIIDMIKEQGYYKM